VGLRQWKPNSDGRGILGDFVPGFKCKERPGGPGHTGRVVRAVCGGQVRGSSWMPCSSKSPKWLHVRPPAALP